jgi:hypothetical protein
LLKVDDTSVDVVMNTVPVAAEKTDVVLNGTGKYGVSLDVGTDCKSEALVGAGKNVEVPFETG